jgi:anti-sigma factor RsiW
MNCDDALPLLYDLVDEELNKNEERVLQAHLAECENCRETLDSIRSAESLYRKEIIAIPPAGLEERLVAALREESALQEAFQPRSRLVRAAFLGLAASVLAAAVYLASLLPESGIAVERALELLSSLSPQWEESLLALSEINLSTVFVQLIDIVKGLFSGIDTNIPATGGFGVMIVLSLIALQIVGSYRLLWENR